MLGIARSKAKKLAFDNYEIINMDGQDLDFIDRSFDAVILNMVLAVIPDGNKCLKEAERVV